MYTSAVITREELSTFLPEAGGYAVDEPGTHGQIDKGNETVWVTIDNSMLLLLEEDDEAWVREREAVLEKLGAKPQTAINLDFARDTTLTSTAVKTFLLAFARRWPCVISHDLAERVYSVAEVIEEH